MEPEPETGAIDEGMMEQTVECTKEKGTKLPRDLTRGIYKAMNEEGIRTKAEFKDKIKTMMDTPISKVLPYYPSEEYVTDPKHKKNPSRDWTGSLKRVIDILDNEIVPDPIVDEDGRINKVEQKVSGWQAKAAKKVYNKLADCMNLDHTSGAAGGGGGGRKSKRKKSKRKKSKRKKSKKTRRRKSKKRKSKRKKSI